MEGVNGKRSWGGKMKRMRVDRNKVNRTRKSKNERIYCFLFFNLFLSVLFIWVELLYHSIIIVHYFYHWIVLNVTNYDLWFFLHGRKHLDHFVVQNGIFLIFLLLAPLKKIWMTFWSQANLLLVSILCWISYAAVSKYVGGDHHLKRFSMD